MTFFVFTLLFSASICLCFSSPLYPRRSRNNSLPSVPSVFFLFFTTLPLILWNEVFYFPFTVYLPCPVPPTCARFFCLFLAMLRRPSRRGPGSIRTASNLFLFSDYRRGRGGPASAGVPGVHSSSFHLQTTQSESATDPQDIPPLPAELSRAHPPPSLKPATPFHPVSFLCVSASSVVHGLHGLAKQKGQRVVSSVMNADKLRWKSRL